MKYSPSFKTRREFLRQTVLGGAMTWTVPAFLAETFSVLQSHAAGSERQQVTGKDATILVVLQMAGGNDGLNTVVPFGNDNYHRSRPRLRLQPDGVLKINETLGLHPSLAGFKSLYDQGWLSVVQGAGYPNPNRSHFRSTEIWQTASDADRVEAYGWLGRYFDHACSGSDPTIGINIGHQIPLAFAAPRPMGVTLENPERYRFVDTDRPGPGERDTSEATFRKLNRTDYVMAADEDGPASGATVSAVAGSRPQTGSALDFIERVALDAQVSSDAIRAVSRRVENLAPYPASALSNSLKLVARLIGGGMSTRVYYLSQGGYDTHTNQAATQTRLLQDLGDSVKAFMEDLKAQGNHERVLLMTFSEFGRRVAENANQGTDHGAAAPLFLAGAKVKAGLLGAYPSLAPADLFRGDLRFTVDFRSVYAGILERWLHVASAEVLGRAFVPMACV